MLQAIRNAVKKATVHAFLGMLALGMGLPAAQAGERIHFDCGNDNAAVGGR
jgi:hypothetical protein